MALALAVDASSPPISFALADLAVGDRCSETLQIDAAGGDAFVACSGDAAPVHADDSFARGLGYPRRIVHGMLTTLRFSRLLGMFLPGSRSVIMNVAFDYLKPVFTGDALDYEITVAHISASGVVRLDCTVVRAAELCVKGRAACLLR